MFDVLDNRWCNKEVIFEPWRLDARRMLRIDRSAWKYGVEFLMNFTNSRCIYLLVAFLSSLTTFRLAICHSYNAFNPPLLIIVSLSSSSRHKNALFISWHWYQDIIDPSTETAEFHLVKFAESQPLLYQIALLAPISLRAGTTLHISTLWASKTHSHPNFARTSQTRRNSPPVGLSRQFSLASSFHIDDPSVWRVYHFWTGTFVWTTNTLLSTTASR